MAEYKGKLLKGLLIRAKNVLLSDGSNAEEKIYSPAPKGTPIEVATGTNVTQNYTPTVDGFATITALSNGSDCFVYIYNTIKDYGFAADASVVGRTIRIYLPVNAGETITYRIGGSASSGVAQFIPMK